jgi:anti-anti-sigma factor
MPEFNDSTLDATPDGSTGFAIMLERDSEGLQVRIVGELDLSTVPQLNHVLDGFADNGHARLLLDLDAVDFMDSSGLAAIVHAHQYAERTGHRLTIRCNSPQVKRLFEITDMLDQLTFE